LGFSGGFVALLIFAESIAIALVGGLLGIGLTFPLTSAFAATFGSLFRQSLSPTPPPCCNSARRCWWDWWRRRFPPGRQRGLASSTGCAPSVDSGRRANVRSRDMTIPFTYIVRNLATRKLTTVLTAGGMALVVYVFATVLMLAAGLESTLVSTGQDDNVVVIRRAAQAEVQSSVDRRQAGIVESLARHRDGSGLG
jgi:ABC-type antimicrobial peptide transport system permease subunit